MVRNQPAVKSSILNKDLVRPLPRNDHPGKVNPRHIALERPWIAHRAAIIRRVQPHSQTFYEGEVRMVARQRKNKLIRQTNLPPGVRRTTSSSVISSTVLLK